MGISQALVSRALSGRAAEIGASPETVERIRRMAAELNYQPSATALALLGAPTRTIGVVVKNFDDPYFGHLIGALQLLARETGNSLLLTGSDARDLTALHKHRVDGVILAGSDFFLPGVCDLAQPDTPVVQIGSGPALAEVSRICMDEETGIADLVSYLAGLGHTDFGFVGGKGDTDRHRGACLRRALRSRGLTVRAKWFFSHEGDAAHIAGRSVECFRNLPLRPTALLAADDLIAFGLLRGLDQAGLRVPRDISVTGIDDIPSSSQTIPPLTTLRQPMTEMAAAAFDLLTRPCKSRKTVSIKGTIVLRSSCAPPSQYFSSKP